MTRSSTVVARMLGVAVGMAVAGCGVAQQAYPSKPIRMITPYAPGGSTTTVGRILAQKLSEGWGQQVLVENRPGGNTIIGTEALVKSPPDGYTILLVTSTHAINPSLLATPYDVVKDFAPVASVVSTEFLLVLHPSVPANNLKEFIALAKSRPGQLNYSSASNGGTTHLAGELFKMTAAVQMQHIPYKGGGPAITDLVGGQVQLSFAIPINVVAFVRNGRLKPIAVSGERRLSTLPHVPTFAEAGLKGYDPKNWFGILAPAGTPKAIVDKLSTELGRILAMADVKEKLDGQGVEPYSSTPDQFAALIKADLAKYEKVIKTANIKLE